ncbi:MAG: DUF1385 domain-containing protein, partial [Pyrinomonadaceae bacterium]
QAVIEGVMMRTPSAYAVACRKSDGSIVHKAEIVPRWCEKYKLLSLPIIRGCVTLLQSTTIGIKALDFSARVFEEVARKRKDSEQAQITEQENNIVSTVVFVLLFNVFVFIVMPFVLTSILLGHFNWSHSFGLKGLPEVLQVYPYRVDSWIAFNLFDGIFRLTLFLLMIFSMTFLKDIKRVFQYHGAEHKTVSAWEKGLNLTVENIKPESCQHPRCGTSFLVLVVIVSIVLFLPISFDSIWANLIARIILLPIVIGIAFEMIRYASKKKSGLLFLILTSPGLWLQKITTQEPDEKQLEVAIFSLKKSLELENQKQTF